MAQSKRDSFAVRTRFVNFQGRDVCAHVTPRVIHSTIGEDCYNQVRLSPMRDSVVQNYEDLYGNSLEVMGETDIQLNIEGPLRNRWIYRTFTGTFLVCRGSETDITLGVKFLANNHLGTFQRNKVSKGLGLIKAEQIYLRYHPFNNWL